MLSDVRIIMDKMKNKLTLLAKPSCKVSAQVGWITLLNKHLKTLSLSLLLGMFSVAYADVSYSAWDTTEMCSENPAAIGFEEWTELNTAICRSNSDRNNIDAGDRDTIFILLHEIERIVGGPALEVIPTGVLPPLSLAVLLGKERIAQILIEHALSDFDARITYQDVGGRTALHLAALKGDNRMYGLLTVYGANESVVDDLGNTPSVYRD